MPVIRLLAGEIIRFRYEKTFGTIGLGRDDREPPPLDEGLGDADFLHEAVTADPSRVNAGSTEGPRTAASAARRDSADMAH